MYNQIRKLTTKQLKNNINLHKGFSTKADFIPVVNFDRFLKGDINDKKVIANEVFEAFAYSGFVYLRDPGIPCDQVNDMFQLSKQFFQLPQEQKELLLWESSESNRGYSKMGSEKLSELDKVGKVDQIKILQQKLPDLKETFEVGNRGIDQKYQNKWPQNNHIFQQKVEQFWDDLHQLNLNVMRCISLGLKLQLNELDKYIDKADNNLRMLHYPSTKKEQLDIQQRTGTHCDYGTITILFQDDNGGLQVQDPKTGQFQNAIPIQNTCNINVGDMLSRISNDKLKSTLHQVVKPFKEDPIDKNRYPSRYSFAYFCNINFDITIDCLPNTYNEKNPKKYLPINSFEYLTGRLKATHY